MHTHVPTSEAGAVCSAQTNTPRGILGFFVRPISVEIVVNRHIDLAHSNTDEKSNGWCVRSWT